ncbi:hypothetical protein KCU92_g232, partial [Aureobasidium melanogenum]
MYFGTIPTPRCEDAHDQLQIAIWTCRALKLTHSLSENKASEDCQVTERIEVICALVAAYVCILAFGTKESMTIHFLPVWIVSSDHFYTVSLELSDSLDSCNCCFLVSVNTADMSFSIMPRSDILFSGQN